MKSQSLRPASRHRRRSRAAFPRQCVRYRCSKQAPAAVPEPARWQHGFPYFGAIADALCAAGLWSRSEFIRFLRRYGRHAPGDKLSCCLCDSIEEKGEIIMATIALHDEERDEWHLISLNRKGRHV